MRGSRVSEEEFAGLQRTRNPTGPGTKAAKRPQLVDAAPSKYKNKKTEVDGVMFASKKEAARYSELKLMEREGSIWNLETQVQFVFTHNDVVICRYYADFQYKHAVQGAGRVIYKTTVEDVKGGKRTKEYIIKKKLMRAFYGIEILET